MDTFEAALAGLGARLRQLAPEDAAEELARVVRLRVPCEYLSLSWLLPEADAADTLWFGLLWATGRCSTAGFDQGMTMPVVRGGFDLVFAERRATVFADAALDPFYQRLAACGIGSGISQAIGSPVQGLLFVGFAETGVPSAEHEAALDQVTQVLSRLASDGFLLALASPSLIDEDPSLPDPREGLLVAEADGRVVWANPAGAALWGVRAEALVGRLVGDLLLPIRTGQSLAGTGLVLAQAIREDGNRVEVEVLTFVEEITGRRRMRLRDQPTQRRRIEEELMRRNAELRVMSAVAHAAVSRLDFADTASDVVGLLARHTTAACAAVLRIESQRLVTVHDCGPCAEAMPLLEARRAELVSGAALRLGVLPSGAEFLAVGLGPAGAPSGVLLLGSAKGQRFRPRDVVLFRTCADSLGGALAGWLRFEALRDQSRQHRELIDSLPMIIFRSGFEFRNSYVSAGLTTILGYTPEEALVPGWGTSILVDQRPTPFAAELTEHLAHGTPIPWRDLRVRHKDGHEVVVSTTLRPIRNADGVPVGVEGVASDVTLEREAQRQLVAADRLAALGLLAAGVGHEINNPTAYISLGVQQIARFAKALRAGASDAPAMLDRIETTLGDMEEGVKRITSIVGELRLFARSPDAPYSGPTDLNALLRSTAVLVDTELRSRARLALSLGELPPQPAGYQRLAQVFLNLLINAAQAIPAGAPNQHRVEATSRLVGDMIEIVVHDTGQGIAPELLPRIFDPFFTTKPPGEGTGLGLAISFDVVKQLGGTLSVESRPGHGSTFTVLVPSLPLDRTPAEGARLEAGGEAGARRRVLVVDDEKPFATGLGWELERRYDVVVACSAVTALEWLFSGRSAANDGSAEGAPCDAPFDAIVCDLRMPGMSGAELFETVRARRPELARRFVFLTGVAATADEARFVAGVGAQVLGKPFDMVQLVRAIEGVIDSVPAPGEPAR